MTGSRWALLCAGLLFVAACGGDDDGTEPDASEETTTSEISRGLVDVGGRQLEVTCRGEGSPTVVFESGLGNDRNEWARVQNLVADTTRACTYSRAGLGKSDAPPEGLRDVRAMVDDLASVVESTPIEGPLVLVGSSWGGMLVRVYAHEHPDDVVGVVLVDSSHPDQLARFRSALAETMTEAEVTALTDQFLDRFEQNSEGVTRTEAADIPLVASADLGDTPLVVLVHGVPEAEFLLPAIEQTWQALQAELAELSSEATLEVVPEASHSSGWPPEVVLQAIQSVS